MASSSPRERKVASSAAARAHGTLCAPGDVAAAQRAFLRVIGHVQQLAAVLPRRAHVDHRLAQVGQDLLLERADLLSSRSMTG